MKAGAGKSEIILAEEYLEIEDFAVIHRTLNARAVVIQSGQTVVLLSLEITSMPDEETYAIRKKIAENYPVEEDHVWVCVTHTFSAPHLLPDFILKDPENCRKSKIPGRTDKSFPGGSWKRLCRPSERYYGNWRWL